MDTISLNEKLNDLQDVICPLCDGSHGNNTFCQMSWSDE